MTTPTDPETPPPGKDADADEIVNDIEHTRERLGETVDALSERLDVKARAQRKIHEAKQRAAHGAHVAGERGSHLASEVKDAATNDQGKPKASVGAGVAAVVAGVVAAIVWRRK